MKKIKITYWIFTGLCAALMLTSAIPAALSLPYAVDYFTRLGYPAYFLPFIGVANLLGLAALIIPGFPRIKEWVYAGFVFDLTAALYSKINVGESPGEWVPVFFAFILLAGSYVFHHKKLKTTPGRINKTRENKNQFI